MFSNKSVMFSNKQDKFSDEQVTFSHEQDTFPDEQVTFSHEQGTFPDEQVMFSNEAEALEYINANKDKILSELQEQQIKIIYTNENTRINVMRNGKRLLKFINRFEGDKSLLDVYKDMVDLKLF